MPDTAPAIYLVTPDTTITSDMTPQEVAAAIDALPFTGIAQTAVVVLDKDVARFIADRLREPRAARAARNGSV